MSTKTIIRTASAAGVIAILLASGGATAQQFKAAGPQPGECKRTYETVVGPSAQAAQVLWSEMVAAKLGNKWAHWVGSSNKVIVPISAGSNPLFQARAQPCFHHPVP